MSELSNVVYDIKDSIELNRSYMPFVKGGGLFIPTAKTYPLGEIVTVDIKLPGQADCLTVQGKVVWITPKHALHLALPGFGIQLVGENAKTIAHYIQNALDTTIETGRYTYWLDEDIKT